MDQFLGRIEVLADPAALAHRAAEWMTATALAAKGRFRVALSGGSTPKALYSLLPRRNSETVSPGAGSPGFGATSASSPMTIPRATIA